MTGAHFEQLQGETKDEYRMRLARLVTAAREEVQKAETHKADLESTVTAMQTARARRSSLATVERSLLTACRQLGEARGRLNILEARAAAVQ